VTPFLAIFSLLYYPLSFSLLGFNGSRPSTAPILRCFKLQVFNPRPMGHMRPADCYVCPKYILVILFPLYDEIVVGLITKKRSLNVVFGSNLLCRQLYSLIKNLKSRTTMRFTDEHLEGCMWVVTTEIKVISQRSDTYLT
jgi:hypothetical protein